MMVLVKTSAQLLAMRFLIGMAEAFVQGGAFCEFRYLCHRAGIRRDCTDRLLFQIFPSGTNTVN